MNIALDLEPAIERVEIGMKLPEYECCVSAEVQQGYLRAAGVDAALFGEIVDVSVLANQCLLATALLRKGRPAGLHMGHRMVQAEPVRLGEPLTVRASIGDVAAMATGTRLRVDLDFVRADGSVPVSAQTTSLRVDREAMRNRRPRPPKDYDTEGYVEAARYRLTPKRVMDYSRQFPGDKVHFDEAVARSIGFRAPVAQGLMTLTWISAAAAAGGVPREIDLGAQFRGPIFWDEEIVLLSKEGAEFQVRGPGGKLCSLGRIAHLSR